MRLYTQRRLIVGMSAVIKECDYEGASVAEIVKSAGCSRKTFYDSFGSKKDAFEFLLRDTFERGQLAVKDIKTLILFIKENRDLVYSTLFCGPKEIELYQELIDEVVAELPVAEIKGQFLVGGIELLLKKELATPDLNEERLYKELDDFLINQEAFVQ